MSDITALSMDLFLSLAKDAPNWSGTPMFQGSSQDRGNLTQLKRAGLITTYVDRGDTFAIFTDAGKSLAAQHGVELD